MIERRQLKNIDKGFVMIIPLILIASSIIQTTASYVVVPGDPYSFLRRHLINIGVGLVAFTLMMLFDYREFQRFFWPVLGVMLILLILVLIPGVGRVVNGARRWIFIGSQSVQPSEVAKFLYIIVFAVFLEKRKGELETFVSFLPCFVFMLVPVGLVMSQPDLGTSLVFFVITFFMMYAAGANPKILFGLAFGGLGLLLLILFMHFRFGMPLPLEGYQLMRLTVFLDPYNDGQGGLGPGYNIIQSLIAIGSGGMWGKGFLQGTQSQSNFLPYHNTDFVFSVVGEEFGFVGSVAILGAYLFLMYRALVVSRESKDHFGYLLVVGVVGMFFFHVLENAGMTMGVMPVTGLPFPMLSYGGTSMWVSLAALGLVASVSIRKKDISF